MRPDRAASLRASAGRPRAAGRAVSAAVLCGGVLLASLAGGRGFAVPPRPPLITVEAERAIARGLKYLAANQAADGAWRCGGGYRAHPCTMTALAGLALMAAGNTPTEGRYAAQVRRGVDYLLGSATGEGLIARKNQDSLMHAHGFAMLFLAQAYGAESDTARQDRIRRVLERAIALTGRAQSRMGGWYYNPDGRGDEGSVTVTQIQGLRACRNAGIKVPKSIITRACEYIQKSANKDGGIRYRAGQGGGSLPAITAAAVATLYNAGQYEHPVAVGALRYTRDRLKNRNMRSVFGGHQFYGMLYAMEAMFLSGEENWRATFPRVRDDLVKQQADDGSWQGDSVGRVYGTAIALIVLQLPYRRLPILQR